MRFRVTVRGTDLELRGYIDGEATLRVTSKALEGIGLVIASPAEDDFDPFAIDQPEYPPTIEHSLDVIGDVVQVADSDMQMMVQMLASIHYAQANVIRMERGRRMQLEKELLSRELHHFETEQENARLEGQLTASNEALTRVVGERNAALDENRRLAYQVSQRG
jgi:hypothetical protein